MFGAPTTVEDEAAVFRLVWSYNINQLDNRKKVRCACDGSPKTGVARILDYTNANCVDHTGSRMFYAIAAVKNFLIYGADITNAFGDAPPPKQGIFVHTDREFREWWEVHKKRPRI